MIPDEGEGDQVEGEHEGAGARLGGGGCNYFTGSGVENSIFCISKEHVDTLVCP